LITVVRPLLERPMRADFRLSAEVVTPLLEEAGEATRGEGIDWLRR